MLTSFLETRASRAMLACFGLGAYLLTAGAPLVHAAAHGPHEERDHAGLQDERIAHSHDEDHHPSLHDVGATPIRGIAKVALPEALKRIEIIPAPAERRASSPLDRILTPRAPPPGDPARAPPQV